MARHAPPSPPVRVHVLTAGTQTNGHTDRSDWEGLNASGTVNPTGVPGLQIDGYFPDTSTSNGTHGWNHDSQFVTVRMRAG